VSSNKTERPFPFITVFKDRFFIFVGGGARSSKQKCFAESWNSAKSEFWDCNLGFRLLAEIRE
jgi:hypothetical protein